MSVSSGTGDNSIYLSQNLRVNLALDEILFGLWYHIETVLDLEDL